MLSLSYAQIINRADWPEGFKTAPVNQAWTDRVLKDANIPDIPPRESGPYIPSSSDITACNDQDTWAFSYDDGPGDVTVNDALIPLKDRNIKATFYVTGQQVAAYPEIVKQMYDEGHSVGIHSWSHKRLTSLTNAEVIAEVVWTASIIQRVIGVVPNDVRPPFQDIDERVRALIQAMGFKISLWNLDSNDWRYEGYTPGNTDVRDPAIAIPEAFRNYVNQPRKGTISLQHDLFRASAKQIAPTLDIVRETPYKFTTVPECAGFPAYGNPLINEILGLPTTGTNPVVEPGPGPQPDPGSVKQQVPPNVSSKPGVVHAVMLLLILNIFL